MHPAFFANGDEEFDLYRYLSATHSLSNLRNTLAENADLSR
jgi:hypothetical protein